MKPVRLGLLSLSILLTAVAAYAQTADEIIDKHIAALGGKEKLNQIKSIYIESTAEVMGTEAPVTITVLNGKGFKSETEFNGNKIVQAVNDKSGWMTNPMGGNAEAMSAEQYKTAREQIYIGGELLDYAAKGGKAEFIGKEGDLYKIKYTTKDSSETTYFIDPATYYLTKTVKKGDMMGQPIEITINFSDYKKTDIGYAVPYKMDTDFGGNFAISANVKKVEINKEVDPKIFEMPK